MSLICFSLFHDYKQVMNGPIKVSLSWVISFMLKTTNTNKQNNHVGTWLYRIVNKSQEIITILMCVSSTRIRDYDVNQNILTTRCKHIMSEALIRRSKMWIPMNSVDTKDEVSLIYFYTHWRKEDLVLLTKSENSWKCIELSYIICGQKAMP